MRAALALVTVVLTMIVASGPAQADKYQLIEGTGSTWSQNAINQWIADVASVGIQVAYGGGGSSKGRRDFGEGTVDFAVTEIPFQGRDPRTGQADTPNGRKFMYMPIVAGGTSFMYHIEVGGKLYTGLRLSGETISKIFTGQITNWDDPEITKDNNGFKLPNLKITPVVRSDGSGTSAQFSAWMDDQYRSIWRPFCQCQGLTSYYPIKNGFVAKDGSVGVAGYVSASYGNGSIGYVEYSYALNDNYPVAKVLNKAGYYTLPTAYNVAVALTKARINHDRSSQLYLTQILTGVYNYTDPRTYPLSSYSYMIVPTGADDPRLNAAKGRTLGDFAYYFLCAGQQEAPALGYSPLPLNLVQAGFSVVKHIPGADTTNKNPSTCDNPTFDKHDPSKNVLAEQAPMPQACDKVGEGPCGVVLPTNNSSGGGGGGKGGGSQGGTGQGQGGSGGSTTTGQQPGPGGTPTVGGPTPSATGTGTDTSSVVYYGTATTVDQYRSGSNSRTLGALVAAELLAFLLIPPLLLKLWRDRRVGRR